MVLVMDDPKIKKQSLSITVGSIVSACLHGIIGYIAAHLFEPVWQKIVKYFNQSHK